jgi:hypothetical protein
MANPWAFGWTPLLTIVGFFVTIGVAYFVFRTFERWKREKIEEKRIDIAIEALELAYDCQEVFEIIRSPGSFGSEYADMPRKDGEDDAEWHQRGPFYATLKRLQAHADFFERLAKLRPRYMALFGVPAAEQFQADQRGARLRGRFCATPLLPALRWAGRPEPADTNGVRRMGRHGRRLPRGLPRRGPVDVRIKGFVEETERRCRPIIDRTYAAKKMKRWSWNKKLS